MHLKIKSLERRYKIKYFLDQKPQIIKFLLNDCCCKLNRSIKQIQHLSIDNQRKQIKEIKLMSKTITTTKQSLLQLTESIQLKDVITFQINSQYLNQNFSIIKECLVKVQQLQNDMGKEKAQKESFNKMFTALETRLKQNQKSINEHDIKIKQLQNNIGDDFMKKLYDIETKTKNTYDFDETVKKLQEMNKFVMKGSFIQQEGKLNEITGQINGLKNQLKRYVENTSFAQFKDAQAQEFAIIRDELNRLNQNNSAISESINKVSDECQVAVAEVKENSKMIKEMNFNDLMDKIKKIKEETQNKLGELSIKMKKKCGLSDLAQLQNNMIEKLDKFLAMNQKDKASTNQTKDALIYLERRLNQIYDILVAKDHDEENDALFSTKKIHCASCTKDLGKFEGRLGQFRPWAVFPCKQLDPEKAGGLGYLTYVDKMHYRRGSVNDDSSLERLNKTFNQKMREDDSPRKMNSTRTTNFMSSFGQENSKNSVSLKDEYFKDSRNEKTAGNKFRVKKDVSKPSTALDTVRQKAKEV